MNNVAVIQSRLQMPASLTDLDQGKWRVLCESVFPNAKTAEAIAMAIDYCRARKLDPFKRPVNIVPMWNKSLGREVETVWPGINEVQVTASRTGKYAGMDEPKWGPDKTQTFEGTVKWKDNGSWKEENVKLTLTFPEWCAVTVYRMVEGQRCAFTEPVYWLEAYARRGKTEVPNDMWAKRSRGQVLKVAKAFSLRAAFPEEGEYVAEEMEGKEIEAGGIVIDNTEPVNIKPLFKNASLRNSWCKGVIEQMEKAPTKDEILEVLNQWKPKCDELIANGNEHDVLAVDAIKMQASLILRRFKTVPRKVARADEAAMRGMPPEDDEWDNEPASVAATALPEATFKTSEGKPIFRQRAAQ